MKNIKNKFTVIVSIVTVVSILSGTVIAAALAQGENSIFANTPGLNGSTTKYEKPLIGDIAQDGAYPDEIESNSSANAQEKEWYEYITYSRKPIGEVEDEGKKFIFYDPYDYTHGMIMKISNPSSEFGEYYHGDEGYTTANEISVSYSVSKSHSWASDVSLDLGFEESVEGGKIVASAGLKFSQNVGVSHTQSGSDDSSASKDLTYNALYFNSNGTPYRWRVVKYTVYLPLYCEIQTLINGEWVVTGTDYYILTTIEGTCREWINNVAYIEDWRTGEPVVVENFWKEFLSEEALKDQYKNGLLPTIDVFERS